MAPPGRRRRFNILPFALLFLLTFSTTASAASAVLGIDIGTEYLKAALVKPGIPLEIVLTKDSKRKEAASVAFKPVRNGPSDAFPERLYGSDAAALAARIPAHVYPNLKPLLGIIADESTVVKDYVERYPAMQISSDNSRGTVAFSSASFNKNQEPFLVEELLAMELQNLKANAETLAGKAHSIKDVVITVPAFYTAQEKRAVELAADLAGLKILGLVSDGLAVGLNYATSRTFESINEGGVPEYNLVFDMGAGSTTATLLKFQGRTVRDVGRFNKTIQEVKVLGTGWDRYLGGDALNAVIFDHMVDEFVGSTKAKQAGITSEAVKAHGRTAAKLWKEAERLRQVLSANSETFASFEGLFEDIDFRYKITRSQFEEMTVSFAARVESPLTQAISAAKIDLKEINSVILHGGGSRTPFVQKQLEKVLGEASKVRTNVNADEAAVFGAVFHGAGLSPSFRVKEIRPVENAAYVAGLQWTSDGKDRRQKLFTPTSETGTEKQVPFKKLEDFSFSLYQQVPSSGDPQDVIDVPVVNIQTHNLTASVAQLTSKFGCSAADISTKFAIRLSSSNALPEVAEGTVSCEVDLTEKKGVVNDVKDFFGFGSKKGDQEPLKEAEEAADPKAATQESKSATSSSVTGSKTASASAATESPEKLKEAKSKVEIIHISFTTKPEGLPELPVDELKRIKRRLSEFDDSDTSRKLREETFNNLEAFTYRLRDLLLDESFIAASTEKERTELEAKLHDTNEWLYGDGEEVGLETLKARMKVLKDLVNPIEKRKAEAIERPEKIQSLKEALNQTRTLVDVVKKQSESNAEEASLASASASSASIASENTESQTTVQPSTEVDDFADLEESTSTSTTTTSSAKPSPSRAKPIYSPEDIEKMIAKFETIEKWLGTKEAEQEKLSPFEDPVISSKELEAKSKELNDAVMELLQKGIRSQTKPKSSKTKSKTKKSKTKSSSTTEAKASETDGADRESQADSDGGEQESAEEMADRLEKLSKFEKKLKEMKSGEDKEDEEKPHDEL
ncbi:MAG: lumenal Hsp70 protein [Sclerophora amabilis]|nr:MAG: lumenal Hsp70 protein [Sclerophora amabilis]